MPKSNTIYNTHTHLHIRTRTRMLALAIMAVAVIVSCKNNDVEDTTKKWTGNYSETLVYEGLLPIDTAYIGSEGEVDYKQGQLWLCDATVQDVLISDAQVSADYSPWRLPTRKEAAVLKTITIDDTDDRYLCFDQETASYYSFKFGGGSVTKAGAKTKYNIRPVRVVYDSDSIIIYL